MTAGALTDVLPSSAAVLGVPGHVDVLGLDRWTDGRPVPAVVVLLVDGLGWNLLLANLDAAPYLAEMVGAGADPLTVGFPSTTVTSMASFGTGEPAGLHGLVGYTFALPGFDGALNALRWDSAADPLDVQPVPTVFERASDAGVDVAQVGLRSFEGSGLTRAALRGARYPGADTVGEAVQVTATVADSAVAGSRRALVYVYTGDLDNVGHLRGSSSDGWRAQLEQVDLFVRQLHRAMPRGALLLVTADHGMVDVGPADRVDVDSEPMLQAGVRLVAGEPRARHVYAREGAASDVLAAWRQRLGATAQVLSREEVVEAGWFGPRVSPNVLPRIGDVVVAPTGPTAVVATRAHPRESRLVGYHGSTTSDEVLVPLLVAVG